MPPRTQLFVICLCSCLASSAIAEGPFGLVKHSLLGTSACDSACDDGCCDALGCDRSCGDSACGERSCCDSVCDCPTCCDASGCDSLCDSKCCPYRYISFGAGWNDLDSYSGMSPAPANLEGTFNDGWLFSLAAGREIHTHCRGELEFSFRSNTADQWFINGVPGNWSGHLFTYSGMANLYHDVSQIQIAGITPYIGVGIGFAVTDGEFQTAALAVDVEDEAFAWQAIAGGSRALFDGVDLFAEYRYFEADFDISNVTAVPTVDLGDHDGQHQSVLLGLRFAR